MYVYAGLLDYPRILHFKSNFAVLLVRWLVSCYFNDFSLLQVNFPPGLFGQLFLLCLLATTKTVITLLFKPVTYLKSTYKRKASAFKLANGFRLQSGE